MVETHRSASKQRVYTIHYTHYSASLQKKTQNLSILEPLKKTLYLCNSEPLHLKKMSRKIKLIWDFRGPASAKTAEHHEIHLKEYIAIEKLPLNITGFKIIDDMYAIAFMVVTDENMIQVRDALKPHRGELYE